MIKTLIYCTSFGCLGKLSYLRIGYGTRQQTDTESGAGAGTATGAGTDSFAPASDAGATD